jgi:hypothetical protein
MAAILVGTQDLLGMALPRPPHRPHPLVAQPQSRRDTAGGPCGRGRSGGLLVSRGVGRQQLLQAQRRGRLAQLPKLLGHQTEGAGAGSARGARPDDGEGDMQPQVPAPLHPTEHAPTFRHPAACTLGSASGRAALWPRARRQQGVPTSMPMTRSMSDVKTRPNMRRAYASAPSPSLRIKKLASSAAASATRWSACRCSASSPSAEAPPGRSCLPAAAPARSSRSWGRYGAVRAVAGAGAGSEPCAVHERRIVWERAQKRPTLQAIPWDEHFQSTPNAHPTLRVGRRGGRTAFPSPTRCSGLACPVCCVACRWGRCAAASCVGCTRSTRSGLSGGR